MRVDVLVHTVRVEYYEIERVREREAMVKALFSSFEGLTVYIVRYYKKNLLG